MAYILALSFLCVLSFVPTIQSAMQTILVTGANSGIGLALCKQLCKDHGVKVLLGARNAERGAAAVQQVKDHCGSNDAPVELVVVDVASDASVQEAANAVKASGVTRLHAIVNNAGTGLGHGTSGADVMNVNAMGPKRVVDHFLPLLVSDNAASPPSRIVNVGSGSGPMYVSKQPLERQQRLCNPDITLEEWTKIYETGVTDDDPAKGDFATSEYGLSKALLSAYTLYLSKELQAKNVVAYCLSPGMIATDIIPDGYKHKAKPVEEGTVSLRHCLFEAPKQESGWFYGSDAKRSPLHVLRNPGEPEFDGKYPW